jgi:hypothetical protein
LEQFWNGPRSTPSERAPATFASGPLSLDSFQPALPSLRITKRQLKRVEAIQLVREQRDNHTQEVSYNARPFVLCGLPLRRPAADQLVYTRRNGSFVLEITAHPRFGLPYGQDRLVPIWMATLALKQKSRTVHFMSPTQLLDYFHLPKDGAQYRRVRAAFQRIFTATIFFGTEQQTKKHTVVESARFHFMDFMRLWFNRSAEPESKGDGASDNTITLSEAFPARQASLTAVSGQRVAGWPFLGRSFIPPIGGSSPRGKP